jgi:sigma-B regulation protein RsbU (phosphoserine phosphatase)
VGVFLTGIGLVAAGLALALWRDRERAPLWFALFTFGYGVRLTTDNLLARLLLDLPHGALVSFDVVVSYLLPVPLYLFLETLIGPGWRHSIRRFWQLHLGFAAVALPVEAWLGKPFALGVVYQSLIIAGIALSLALLFWPGTTHPRELRGLRVAYLVLGAFALNENLQGLHLVPWRFHVEWVGFLLFLAALGAVAARHTLGAQRRLQSIRQELETARTIQTSILPAEVPRLPGLDLAVRYVPAAEVAGDYYDFLPVDRQHLGLVIADVSGHGIPAALIASMVKVAVGAQQDNAASPARVLAGMSRIFHGKLKRHFITAACLFADLEAGRLVHASAGHPPPLLWRAVASRVEELRQDGQVLGRFARAEYREAAVTLEPGDRVLLFTDGIPEARDRNGEPFGDERLRAFLEAHADLAADPLATALIAEITSWTGRHSGFEDDLTVIVLGMQEPENLQLPGALAG